MKVSKKKINGIVGAIGILLLLLPLAAYAQNKVVVIPLFDGACTSGTCKPLKNIVTVAKANGMFTDPVAAVESIKDANQNNPYIVVIGPGVYTVTSTLQMKPYVDITGSGENVTQIKGAISTGDLDTAVIIRGANYSSVSFLTVENTGGGSISIALFNGSASPRVSNVTAIASGGTFNFGVVNDSSSPIMINVTTMATTASGGTDSVGLFNGSSSPAMTNVTATASGGSYNFGVHNYSSSPIMTNVTAMATEGKSYGVYNLSSSSLVIRRSTLSGGTDGLHTESGTTAVSQSTIQNGAVVETDGTNQCVACDNGVGVGLGVNCN